MGGKAVSKNLLHRLMARREVERGVLAFPSLPPMKKNTRRVYPDRVFPWEAVNQATIARDARCTERRRKKLSDSNGEAKRLVSPLIFLEFVRSIITHTISLCVNLHSEPTRKMDRRNRAIGMGGKMERWQVRLWSRFFLFSRYHFPSFFFLFLSY